MITAAISIFYYILLTVWSLVYFVFMLVLFACTAPFDKERIVLHKASRVWAMSIFRINPLWKLRVEGKQYLRPGDRYVVTVNHQSMLDIPLMYVLPYLNFKWVAKTDVYKWPLFGIVLRLHGDITVDPKGSVRKTMHFIEAGSERLNNGTSVIIFPEGTRSRDGEIHNFKDGAFMLARHAGAGILPCVIDGGKNFIKGWRLQPTTFTVRITPPIPATTVQDIPLRQLIADVRQRSVDELQNIRS